jgi:hypothetical protein
MISPISIGRFIWSESILDSDDLWLMVVGWIVVDVTIVALATAWVAPTVGSLFVG